MSWSNSESPTDWPSKKKDNKVESDYDFSTTQSGSSSNIEPTVAIQTNVQPGSEPWRQAIQAPKEGQQESSQRLTRLFVPPPDFAGLEGVQQSAAPLPRPQDVPSSFESSSTQNSELDDTTGSPRSSRQSAPDRRSKVFGQPDTYTNERLGNLSTSMGGMNNGSNNSGTQSSGLNNATNEGPSGTFNPTARSNGGAPLSRNTAGNTTANESDSDIADQLQNEGRKVLQGLAPFRSTSPPVQESSLDQLEQQLTSQGPSRNDEHEHFIRSNTNQPHTSIKMDTTSSSSTSDSGNTLESLPAGLSNWDTMGPVPHHHVPKPSYLHRSSSQTLIGSGGRQRKQRQTELADLEAEISALGIQEPYRHPSPQTRSTAVFTDTELSVAQKSQEQQQLRQRQQQEQQHQQQLQQQQAQRQAELQKQAEARVEAQIKQAQLQAQQQAASSGRSATSLSTSQRSSSVQTRLSNSDAQGPVSTSASEQAYTRPYSSPHYALNNFDITPETIVRRNLRFERPAGDNQRKLSGFLSSPMPRSSLRTASKASRTPSLPTSRVTSSSSARRTASSSEPVHRGYADDNEDMSEVIANDNDKSIAAKSMSFSAGYELLAELIRERAEVPGARPDTLDSSDLSNCDLESIVGLDEFTPHLTTLFLNDNRIRNLEGLPFNLVHLDLSSNCLSFMNMFPQSFVSTLILANNDLENLEPLANLRALSSLDVSNNRLKSSKGIENLTALRTLNVNNNRLTALDVNLGMLSELSAAHNDIRAVRLNAPNLESLDSESNRVIALTEPLPNLRELNIRFNDASVDFRGWESLETSLFDGNRSMVNIEEVAGNLVTFSWEQYKGYKGPKTRVPQALSTSARDLKLGGSSSLGWPFGSSARLVYSTQHLDLSNSGIRESPAHFSKQFPFLKSANFAFNKLTDECITVLSECRNLERSSSFGNRLQTTGEKLAQKSPKIRILDSRSQNRARDLIQDGEYATDVYTPLEESNNGGTLVNTRNPESQWLDGKWTTHAGSRRPTTRPAFPSALYPSSWNPPARKAGTVTNDSMEASMIGTLTPWDVVEAMYVHHYLQTVAN